jgi:competence protein ComEC
VNQTKLWGQNPFARILLWLIIGYILAELAPNNHTVYLIILIGLVGIVGLLNFGTSSAQAYHYRWLKGLLIALCLIVGGFNYAMHSKPQHRPNYFAHKLSSLSSNTLLVKVIENKSNKRSKLQKLVVEVKKVRTKKGFVSGNGRMLLQLDLQGKLGPKPGEDLLVFGKVDSTVDRSLIHTFSYAAYLAQLNIYHRAYVDSGGFYNLGNSSKLPFRTMVFDLQSNLAERLKSAVRDSTAQSILMALILGNKSNLDAEVRTTFSQTGTLHVLAVSGLHVGIIYLVLSFVLNQLRIKRRVFHLLLTLLGLWLFAVVSGLSPSVCRASFMFSILSIGKNLKRPSNAYNTLAASASILLIINPMNLVSMGFWFSHLAVLGIVFYTPFFMAILPTGNLWLFRVKQLLCVSLSAQLIIFPLSVYFFHQFPWMFLVSNLIVIPLITLLLYVGLLLVATSPFAILSSFIGKIFEALSNALITSLQKIEDLSFSNSENIYWSISTCVLVYLLIILLTRLLFFRSKALHWMGVLLLCCLLSFQKMHNERAVYTQHKLHILETRNGMNAFLFEHGTVRMLYPVDLESYQWQNQIEPYLLGEGFEIVKDPMLEVYEDSIPRLNKGVGNILKDAYIQYNTFRIYVFNATTHVSLSEIDTSSFDVLVLNKTYLNQKDVDWLEELNAKKLVVMKQSTLHYLQQNTPRVEGIMASQRAHYRSELVVLPFKMGRG